MERLPGRRIVIMGMSHCGSTVLSTLFNSVPGVLGIGEIHWFNKPNVGGNCTICGPSCQVISKLNRNKINPKNLYQEVLKASGRGTLVTSDKVPGFVDPLVVPKQFEVIVLFKRPECFADSYSIRRNITRLKDFPDFFTKWYGHINFFAKTKASKVTYLEYESFIQNMHTVFPKLCAELNLKAPKSLDFPPLNAHNFKGNASTFNSERYKQKSIVLDERWKTSLTPEDKKLIKKHTSCQNLWAEMRRKAVK